MGPWSRQTGPFTHIHESISAQLHRLPLKALDLGGENRRQLLHGQGHARAAPPPCADGQQLKMLALNVPKPIGPGPSPGSKNLSGQNSNGLSQTPGFLPMDQKSPTAFSFERSCFIKVKSLLVIYEDNFQSSCTLGHFSLDLDTLEILRWLNDEEDKLKAAVLPRIRFLIVEMSPVTDIDTSGVHALEELRRSLQKRDVQVSSSVLRNSFASSGVETTTHWTEPRRRRNKGLWRDERS
ncbi:hypothetical protein RJ639_038607 [Escallonia herrerae]|uniref:STAS domain-containing protein n=1 Tax=Escallonia herrerae TaxID=1293975 RepID=A0AA88WIX8_9ASTE|nr:hypothetical protein RJ639_038607 [Escallonia herrerae]